MIPADAKTYDVLAYDPAGARALLTQPGCLGVGGREHRLSLEYLFPGLPHLPPIAAVLQQQWRRLIDLRTAAIMATLLNCVKGAETVYTGKARPEALAVKAPDDFTSKVELSAPVPLFVSLTASGNLTSVPRQAIEAAHSRGIKSSWTRSNPGGSTRIGDNNHFASPLNHERDMEKQDDGDTPIQGRHNSFPRL